MNYNIRHKKCILNVLKALYEYKNKNGISDDVMVMLDDMFIPDSMSPERARVVDIKLGNIRIGFNFNCVKHNFRVLLASNINVSDFNFDSIVFSEELIDTDSRCEMYFASALSWLLGVKVKWEYEDKEEWEENT